MQRNAEHYQQRVDDRQQVPLDILSVYYKLHQHWHRAEYMNGNVPEPARRNKARERWKLLRHALLEGRSSQSSRSFEGYRLLPSPTTLTAETNPELKKALEVICAEEGLIDAYAVLEVLSVSLMALISLDSHERSFAFQLPLSFEPLASKNETIETFLKEHCLLEDCQCHWMNQNEEEPYALRFRIRFRPQSNLFVVRQYTGENGRLVARTRERSVFRLTLHELTSHRHHQVDNTGNVSVWDAEKVLTWVLQQQEKKSLQSVTELGVGMAGIAALSLSSHVRSIVLTDGHEDCVRNNQVNVRIMQASDLIPKYCTVTCQRLLWSTEVTIRSLPRPADWTLVSDCVHFQEFHAGLFWTLVQCTKVNGVIWMCQPERGGSLRRFLELVRVVNESGPSLLLDVEELRVALLDELHEMYARDDSTYDPEVHRPRIYRLRKVRQATEEDRVQAILHVQKRDK